MDFSAISWLGVVLAALAFFIIGSVWYGLIFGTQWIRLSGLEEEAASSSLPLVYLATALLGLAGATGLAALIGPDASAGHGFGLGLAVAAVIVAPVLAIHSLYDRQPAALWLLNAGYNAVGFAVMGLLIGVFQ